MKTALVATCPGCQTKVEVTASGNELNEVSCKTCGKRFAVRVKRETVQPEPGRRSASTSKPRGSTQPQPASARDSGLEDLLSAPLPEMNPGLAGQEVNWNNYRVRKPLPVKLILTCIGVSVGLVAVATLGMWGFNRASNMDMGAVTSFVQGRPDNPDYLYSDWKRFRDEQSKILSKIERRSDCIGQLGPMEQVAQRHIELISRAAMIETVEHPKMRVGDLPPFPTEQTSSERSFRGLAAVLTLDFQKAETSANDASEVLLRYFHSCVSTAPSPSNDYEKMVSERIAIKRLAARRIAMYRRGQADENETSVTIYELVESLKTLRDKSVKPDQATVAALPQSYRDNEILADRMLQQLAIGQADDPESVIGKSFAAFQQAASF